VQGHDPVLMWHANVAKERNCRRPGSSERPLCSSRNAEKPRCEQDGRCSAEANELASAPMSVKCHWRPGMSYAVVWSKAARPSTQWSLCLFDCH
jgi:hypothetical protein